MIKINYCNQYKLIQLAATLVLLLSCSQYAIAAKGKLVPWRVEQSTAEFSLPDVKNQMHSSSDFKGKVILLNFWASWCPPCIQEMPELEHLKQQMADQPFEVIAINVGEKRYKVRKFLKLIKFDLPVLLDTKKDLFNDWDLKSLPTSFLIDANGHIRYKVRGNPGWENENTLATIQQLISEQTGKN
jgi:thiol-disulfide isomerase/thioredoxin